MDKYEEFATDFMVGYNKHVSGKHIQELASQLKKHFIPREVVRVERIDNVVKWQVDGTDGGCVMTVDAEAAMEYKAGFERAVRALGLTVEPFPPQKPVITAEEWAHIRWAWPWAKWIAWNGYGDCAVYDNRPDARGCDYEPNRGDRFDDVPQLCGRTSERLLRIPEAE